MASASPSLREFHARAFDARIRDRGAEYHEDGAVELLDVTDDAVDAIVTGSRRYHVSLRGPRRKRSLEVACDCPNALEWGRCKHVWATLLAVDDLEQGAGAEQSAEAGAPSRPRSRPRAVVPRVPEWQRRLAALPLRARPESGERTRPVPVLEYHVRPASTAFDAALHVHVRARTRKQSGELGAPVMSLQRDVASLLPPADQWLLAAREEQDEYFGWHSPFARPVLSLREPWRIRPSVLAAVLPWLAATGRVFAADDDRVAADPRAVRVDTGDPFAFEVVTAPPAGRRGRTRLHGRFRRGDDVLELRDAGAGVFGGAALAGDRLVRIDCGGALPLVVALLEEGPLEVPDGEVPAALARLAHVPGSAHFLAGVLAELPAATPIATVTITWPKSAAAPLEAELQFDYAGSTVAHGDPSPLALSDAGVARRDAPAEARLHAAVAASGLVPNGDRFRCERAALAAAVAALTAAGIRVFAAGKLLRPWQAGTGSVTTGIDWFDLGGEIVFAGHTTTLPALLRRKLVPEGFVELGDGSFGLLPEQWLRRLHSLRVLVQPGSDGGGDTLRVPSSQALLLDALLLEAGDGAFEVDARFAAIRERIAGFTRIEPVREPAGFRGELRPYQRQGLAWLHFLREFGLGGCLADDMGLGKTVQVLALLLGEHARRGTRKPSLLVAPRSVLANWLAEAQRFAPALRVLDFSGADRWAAQAGSMQSADVVLTTYGLVRADAPRFVTERRRFHCVILDESQAIKNAASQASKAVRLLQGSHRLALSGTPIENHLGELWSLFEFLNPGMLGRLPAFTALFGGDVTAADMRGNRAIVQRALRPVLLRRTKSEVLTELPPKVDQTLWCELEPPQRRRYDALRDHYRQKLLDGADALAPGERFVVLEALLRLRQAACHEGLLDPMRRTAASAKLDALLPRLEELAAEGHKALVFSQFTSMLDLIEPQLRTRGIVFERLDGSTRDRAARVARFQQEPDCRVFLISLKAGGVGLNLTAASYVFLLDPWWNPAVEMQAIDRAHRIGQQRTVHAYRLVCRGTVEERVLELQANKKALCDAILGNERSLLQDMTRDDLELLLR